MRQLYRVVAMASAGLAFWSSTSDAQSRIRVVAENPIAVARASETVAVPWSDVTRLVSGAAADRIRVRDADGRELVSQVVDNDGDGKMDELIFQGDFRASERRSFTLESGQPQVQKVAAAFARHDPPRDDMAWESDRIAFRIYGEGLKKTPSAMSSNGIDVWPKRVKALIVEKWYAKGHDEYHIDKGEGADFFDVGQTLGAGGTAIWAGDSIHRGDNFKAHRIIANGPIRAIFELRYDPWKGGGHTVSEVKRIAIDAGQNLYRSESIFTREGGGEIPYAIGLVKRPGLRGTETIDSPWPWLSGWGPVAPKNGGHGELGTAILIPRSQWRDWKEIGNHYLAIGRATSGQPAVHYVGAGWTASGDFPTPQSWWAYLDNYAQRLAAPLKVTVSTN
jgi:pectinesterase